MPRCSELRCFAGNASITCLTRVERYLLLFSGQSKTMFGSLGSAKDLGAIPCAISWLYKGINERRQKTGARFSVRVSALGVSASKPGSAPKDLLTAHATGK